MASAAAGLVSRSGCHLAGLPLRARRPCLPRAQPLRQPAATRSRSVTVQARYSAGRGSPDVADRVLSAIPYLLPFLDAFSYGRFLFWQVPAIKAIVAPFIPVLKVYAGIPFAPLICFFAIYLGIVNNMQWSRFVRFNAMQAVLLDILLVLPRLLESLISPPTSGWGLQAYITSQNTIWIFVAASVVYGVGSALLGQRGSIPFIGDAADQQVR